MGSQFRLSEYRSISISELSPARALPFSVSLHFPKNERLVLWHRKGDALHTLALEKCRVSGVSQVWISQSDWPNYESWRHAQQQRLLPLTHEGALIRAVLKAQPAQVSAKLQRVFASESGQLILRHLCKAKNLEDQEARDARITISVLDSLNGTASPRSQAFRQLASLSALTGAQAPLLSRTMICVTLALAHQKVDLDWLTLLALSSLIPTHLPQALSFLKALSPADQSQIQIWREATQKHESGFLRDEGAEILRLAQTIELIRTGLWDGQRRTRFQAIQLLDEPRVKSALHPNPEFLGPLRDWIRPNLPAAA